jgi:hypothetical protein
MKTYLIQRNLPGAGKMTAEEKKALAQRSNKVIAELGPENLQWIHSYITPDNIWCIYLASSEEVLKEHAKRGLFPCDVIREIQGRLSPVTASMEITPEDVFSY